MAHGSGNLEPDHPMPRVPASRPKNGALLWVIVFVIAALIVMYGIRRFATRSSAEGQGSSMAWPADDGVQLVSGLS